MSQSEPPVSIDRQIADAQLRIGEQKRRLQRMIAQGTIAQCDDDLLRDMYLALTELKAARARGLVARG
jgi:hypothetical protein